MRADSVVGYLFKAETFCREHLPLKVDSTFRQSGVIDSNGRLFDGSDSLNLDGTKVGFSDFDAEDLLDIYADVLKIDRMEESSFDSGDFPKIIFHSDEWDGDCHMCDVVKELEELKARKGVDPVQFLIVGPAG